MGIKDMFKSIFTKPEQVTVLAFGKSPKNESSVPVLDGLGYLNQLYMNSEKYVCVELKQDMTEDEVKTALATVFVSFGLQTDLAVLATTDSLTAYDLVKLGDSRFTIEAKLKTLRADDNTKFKVSTGYLTEPEFFSPVTTCKMKYEQDDMDDVVFRRGLFMRAVCSLISDYTNKDCDYIGLADCDEPTAMEGAYIMETLLDGETDISKVLAFAKKHFFQVL